MQKARRTGEFRVGRSHHAIDTQYFPNANTNPVARQFPVDVSLIM
jgi:hypothetical protein